MENLTQDFIAWTAQFPGYIALAIFLSAFLESLAIAGILVPGIVLLFGLAGLAGSGALTLQLALLAAFMGAVAGDITSFCLGRYFSDRLKGVWPLSKFPELVTRSETFFHQHGGKSVIIGRFIGPIRPVLPAMAGILGMPTGKFILYNIISALLWAPWYIVPGFLFGAAVRVEAELPRHFYPSLLLLTFCILTVTALFVQFHWHLRPESTLYRSAKNLLGRSPAVKTWLSNSYSCRQQRREYPLSSAVLFIVSGFGLALFTLLMSAWPDLKRADIWLISALKTLHYPVLDTVFVMVTMLGDPALIYLLLAWFIVLVSAQKKFTLATVYVIAGLSTHALTGWLKDTMDIVRPYNPYPHDSFSYPSGHTAGTTLALGLIAASLARERSAHQRWPIYTGAGIITLLVAVSRLYLGVHWLSDVIGGLLLGLMMCGLGRALPSTIDRQPLWRYRWRLALLAGLIIIVVAYQTVYLASSLLLYNIASQ